MPARDIIVIGASAGGVEAIKSLVSHLPADLPAAVFVTLHLNARSPGVLPQLLSLAGPLPAVHAEDGMLINPGHIYVAPPDHHLVIQQGFMQLSHGPRENLNRPCINVMFRSAAAAYDGRVAGVLLTGMLDDGSAGLWDIQRAHGATIVQDPDEATFRSMPENAIHGLNVQYIVRLQEIPPLLSRLARSDRNENPLTTPDLVVEPVSQACPECGGATIAARMGKLLEFRCHTGHRLGLRSMIALKSSLVESALGTALSQSEELSALLRTALEQVGPEECQEIEAELQRRRDEQDSLRRLMDVLEVPAPTG